MSIVDKIRNNPRFAAGNGVLATAPTTATDLPIAGYDEQTEQAIADKLSGFSQPELRMIGAYEASRKNRAAIIDRIVSLTSPQ
jgi:hypothetical protein